MKKDNIEKLLMDVIEIEFLEHEKSRNIRKRINKPSDHDEAIQYLQQAIQDAGTGNIPKYRRPIKHISKSFHA